MNVFSSSHKHMASDSDKQVYMPRTGHARQSVPINIYRPVAEPHPYVTAE